MGKWGYSAFANAPSSVAPKRKSRRLFHLFFGGCIAWTLLTRNVVLMREQLPLIKSQAEYEAITKIAVLQKKGEQNKQYQVKPTLCLLQCWRTVDC